MSDLQKTMDSIHEGLLWLYLTLLFPIPRTRSVHIIQTDESIENTRNLLSPELWRIVVDYCVLKPEGIT